MTRRESPAAFGKASAVNSAMQGRPETSRGVQSLPAPRKHPLVLGVWALAYLLWLIALVWIAILAERGN
jgi:hypothetical protein